jgi:hypothetical protein
MALDAMAPGWTAGLANVPEFPPVVWELSPP